MAEEDKGFFLASFQLVYDECKLFPGYVISPEVFRSIQEQETGVGFTIYVISVSAFVRFACYNSSFFRGNFIEKITIQIRV